jgi:signal transduction histidine kinase
MNTLRAKVALLLVTSIVSVVALITLATIYIFRPPTSDVVTMAARQMILMERLARLDPRGAELAPRPHSGEIDADETQAYRATIARLGADFDVMVTRKLGATDRRLRTVSIHVGSHGWLVTDIYVRAPTDFILWCWFGLLTGAVATISLVAANRVSKPLALLESAVESVSQDAILPQLPVRGSTEVRATTAALNSLSARLQKAIESRMRLVAAAGHDLRTPLTRMRLRAEFVTDRQDRALWLKDIDELDRIADSAIQLVREESHKAPPEIIPVDDLVRSVAEELRDQKFQIEVCETGRAYVKASHLALSRALRNLLMNAATHGVRGSVSVTGGAVARITIRDHGPGIAPELMDQVFEPFFRADRARRQQIPGAGLGLTISREIVRRAGGDIRIANRPRVACCRSSSCLQSRPKVSARARLSRSRRCAGSLPGPWSW